MGMRVRNRLATLSGVLVILMATSWPAVASPVSCSKLKTLKLADATITSAEEVPAGGFNGSIAARAPAMFKQLPAFCRVMASLRPSSDSDIKVEVWMPVAGWNGRFRGQGNGGFAGMIDYAGLAIAVSKGYASAGTDTGHSGSPIDAAWAAGHPEKVIDFGYRSVHEMTLKAQAIIRAFYGAPAKRSYFASCSDGGREALMEAQRYPGDYDGILAGAPANYWTHLLTAGAWDLQALQNNPASYIPAAKIPAIAKAVVQACDANDGVKDGIINDPRQCHFDPRSMLCKNADSETCLTAPQATALTKIYEGPKNSKGQQLFPGFVPGGEEGPNGWASWVSGRTPDSSLQYAFTTGYFRYLVFNNPQWDFRTFNFDQDVEVTDKRTAMTLNATDPNLAPFQKRGGKLIIYHGWSDAAISPLNSIDYFNSVTARMGEKRTAQFLRLYMVPGMQHCASGPGPDSFGQQGLKEDPHHDIYAALEQWVEKGAAPDSIIATKSSGSQIVLTRPLCPYPEAAMYKGSGSTNDASNFECRR